ncbi:MAG: hypothetical protein C3F07_19870 [Anaerolineales bacterium]|nr:MAG: hypothetical protein C3F07_19870 [Anaerolineales bacterium]
MNLLSNGLSILVDHWQLAVSILALLYAGQRLVSVTLRAILGDSLTTIEYVSLGLAGWLAPVSLLSLLWMSVGMQQIQQSWIPFWLLIVIIILPLSRFKMRPKPDSTPTFVFLILFIISAILLRLAFVSGTVFPLYFDSATHYDLIKNVLGNRIWSASTYYHLGFHFLAGFVTSTAQANITSGMLILGQVVLAVLPVSVFFLVRHETQSKAAGIFAVILSAYGWYMPAHAVNWGKYPALMGLGLLPFGLSLMYLIHRRGRETSPSKRASLYALSGVVILLSGFAHSRTLVVYAIVILAWFTGMWWQKLPKVPRVLMFLIVAAALTTEVVFIRQQEILARLFDPYLNVGLPITILVLLLSVFALKAHPGSTFVCFISICLLLGSVFIPVTGLVPGYGDLTLLDRPFVEMLLFLPLAWLGGFGLAGMENYLRNSRFGSHLRMEYVSLFVLALVTIYSVARYDFRPSDCCAIVGKDDVVAMDWIDGQLPVDARIGIAVTEMKVMASDSFEGYSGGDAGIWITPLIGRKTSPLPYVSDFGQQNILDSLCRSDIRYLYVGETGQRFDDSQLNANPAWYKPLLFMPGTKVYEVIGCE